MIEGVRSIVYITHAYIDPGTISLAIQMLIAGFIGGLFFIKAFWRKIKAFLKHLSLRIRKGNG